MDRGSIIVAAITLILFILALFFKGLTHDILLEAAVFLVSVKLIMANYTITRIARRIESKIDNLNR